MHQFHTFTRNFSDPVSDPEFHIIYSKITLKNSYL